MSTFYIISPGYTYNQTRQLVWKQLKLAYLEICSDFEALYKETADFQKTERLKTWITQGHSLGEYVLSFKDRNDLTIYHSDEKEEIVMNASGGDAIARAIKEETRRAFIRLLIQKMHQQGLNIDINIS